MATPIELEPEPRNVHLTWISARPFSGRRHALSVPAELSGRPFLDVLWSRRSAIGNAELSESDLSCLLWHSMMLRERRPATGRYLDWESRVYPSAGGLHPITLLCLPVGEGDLPLGLYDPRLHQIAEVETDTQPLSAANGFSVERLCGAKSGMTLQFAADRTKVDAAYQNGGSLLWRDAGVLAATIALTAEAFGLAGTPLGRTGHELLGMAGLTDPRWMGVGAVHVMARE